LFGLGEVLEVADFVSDGRRIALASLLQQVVVDRLCTALGTATKVQKGKLEPTGSGKALFENLGVILKIEVGLLRLRRHGHGRDRRRCRGVYFRFVVFSSGGIL
jgi:hypothetical protein